MGTRHKHTFKLFLKMFKLTFFQDGKDYIPLNTFISGEHNMENLNQKDRNQTASESLMYTSL